MKDSLISTTKVVGAAFTSISDNDREKITNKKGETHDKKKLFQRHFELFTFYGTHTRGRNDAQSLLCVFRLTIYVRKNVCIMR